MGVRGREYPWGTVNIEDKAHCDFLALRNLVLAHHMQDLKDTTHAAHYENYRGEKLREMVGSQEIKNKLSQEESALDEELRSIAQDNSKTGRRPSFMRNKM